MAVDTEARVWVATKQGVQVCDQMGRVNGILARPPVPHGTWLANVAFVGDEIIDLVRGGQGVFGIAVGQVYQEVEGSLAVLPAVSPEGDVVIAEGTVDELATRRRRKTG